MERRLDDSQNRSPRFGEEEEIGNVTLSCSHLAHSVVTIPTELYCLLALAGPVVIKPLPPKRRSRNLDSSGICDSVGDDSGVRTTADSFEHFSYVVELMMEPK